MPDDRLPAITDADIQSLTAKLKALSPALTPPERALLSAAFARAAGRVEPAHGEVQGFVRRTTGNPFASLDAIDLDTPVGRDRRAVLRQRLGELR